MSLMALYAKSITEKFYPTLRVEGPIAAFAQIKKDALVACVASQALAVGGYFLTNVSSAGVPVGLLGAPVLFAGVTATLASYNIYKLACNASGMQAFKWPNSSATTPISLDSRVRPVESDKLKLTQGTLGLHSVVEYFFLNEAVRVSVPKDDDEGTVRGGQHWIANDTNDDHVPHTDQGELLRHDKMVKDIAARRFGDYDEHPPENSDALPTHLDNDLPSLMDDLLGFRGARRMTGATPQKIGIGAVQHKVAYVANVASVVGYIALSLLITSLVVARTGPVGMAFGVAGTVVGAPALAVAYAIYQFMQETGLAMTLYGSMTEKNFFPTSGASRARFVDASNPQFGPTIDEKFWMALVPETMKTAERAFPSTAAAVKKIFAFM